MLQKQSTYTKTTRYHTMKQFVPAPPLLMAILLKWHLHCCFGHLLAMTDQCVRLQTWEPHGTVSYQCSILNTALKCTILSQAHETDREADRQRKRQTDGEITAMLHTPPTAWWKHNNHFTATVHLFCKGHLR